MYMSQNRSIEIRKQGSIFPNHYKRGSISIEITIRLQGFLPRSHRGGDRGGVQRHAERCPGLLRRGQCRTRMLGALGEIRKMMTAFHTPIFAECDTPYMSPGSGSLAPPPMVWSPKLTLSGTRDHPSMHACMHACIHTYTHIHTYIHTYVPTYLRTYVHTYTRTYIHTYIHTQRYKPIYLPTYLPTYLRTYVPTYLRTHVHTYIHTYIHTNIPTYQHTNIPTYHHHRPQGGGTRRTIPPSQATGGGGPWGGEGGAWESWVMYIYIYIIYPIHKMGLNPPILFVWTSSSSR